jgi:hypothetical protein
MFRESDFPDPKYHQTFSTKEKPVLQLQTQAGGRDYATELALAQQVARPPPTRTAALLPCRVPVE